MKKHFFILAFLLSVFLYPIPYTLYPLFAQAPVDLGKEYAFGGITSVGEAFGYLVTPAFSIAGVAVVIYFAIGALRYMMSGGDKQAVESARKMITHAIIGFILLIAMFLILEFIPEYFGIPGVSVIK